jgi:hypothetical protein
MEQYDITASCGTAVGARRAVCFMLERWIEERRMEERRMEERKREGWKRGRQEGHSAVS